MMRDALLEHFSKNTNKTEICVGLMNLAIRAHMTYAKDGTTSEWDELFALVNAGKFARVKDICLQAQHSIFAVPIPRPRDVSLPRSSRPPTPNCVKQPPTQAQTHKTGEEEGLDIMYNLAMKHEDEPFHIKQPGAPSPMMNPNNCI